MKLSDSIFESLYSDFHQFVKNTSYREDINFYTPDFNNIIDLSYNENPFGPSPRVLEAIKYFQDYVNLYPPVGYTYLRSIIAAELKIKELEIIIGNGSLGVINSAIRLFAEKYDNVIYSKSSIPMYKWGILSNGSIPIEVPLQPDYNHDLDGLLAAITPHTKVVILDNPHNPTGLYIVPETILSFIKKIPENILVIIDQAYIEYADDYVNEAIIKSFNKFNNLLITRTFSKIHALAGLRIGYGIGNEELIKKLWSENLGNVGGVSLLSSFAAAASVKDTSYLYRSKDLTCQRLDSLKEDFVNYFEFVLKSSANFICFKKNVSLKELSFNIKVTQGINFGYPELIRASLKSDIS